MFFLTELHLVDKQLFIVVFIFNCASINPNQFLIFFAVAFLINLLCADFNTI